MVGFRLVDGVVAAGSPRDLAHALPVLASSVGCGSGPLLGRRQRRLPGGTLGARYGLGCASPFR
ncbi:hypothetical protein PMIN05_006016 [Paraphaeosphaeria minitans]